MAVETLLSVVELIKSTKSEEICKVGVECIIAQKFEPHILFSQLSHVLEGLLRAVSNASLSVPDGFEALNLFAIQMAGRMRELAHIWAPLIYEKLLSFEGIERELADNYLRKMKVILLPPTQVLSKVVAESVQNKLLQSMQRMVQSQCYKVPVIKAWGWLIWLLGGRVLQNRELVNNMLKILEQTFLDTNVDVRIASQVSWKAMVDILIPAASGNRMDRDLSGGNQEPSVQLTSKRMKLLITPLVVTMTVEKSAKVWNSCWMICVYILQKLACSVNKVSVMQHIILPLFESIFKAGRNNWNRWVWDSCASLFEEFLSLKINVKRQKSVLPIDGPPIKWSPWMLCHMEFLLKIFRSLWKSYAGDVPGTENRKICLKFVLRIWHLLIEGLDMEGKATDDPSNEHRAAVHLFLYFVNSSIDEVAFLFASTRDRDLVFSLWSLLEYMMVKLRPSVLLSPFYKLPVNLRNVNGTLLSSGVAGGAIGLVGNNPSYTVVVQFEEMRTPVAYAAMIWLKFVASLSLDNRKTSEALNLKVDDHWLLCIWRAFAEHRLVAEAEIASDISCGSKTESRDQFLLCSLLFPCLVSSISKAREIIDKAEYPIMYNAVPSSGDLWFLTEDFSKVCNPIACHLFFMISGHPQQFVITSSDLEFPVEKANHDVPECSLFMDIRCKFAEIYGRFVVCLVQELLSILNSNDSFHSSGLDCSKDGGGMNQTSMLSGTLSLAARFLMLMYEAHKVNAENSKAINRVCEALVCLSNSLHTQYDILSFVQTLSEPLAEWLCACSGSEHHFTKKSMMLDLENILSLKQTENNHKECETVTRSFVRDNMTNFTVANSCDGSILALVSRYLIIAWDAQNYNSKIYIDSVSRVYEGLICFSNYLKAQHDTVQYMQTLSKPLVKWFSGSVHSEISDDTCQQMLLLEKVWHQLLASLQNCQPPISFDSDLLNLQAPLLASAFQCSFKPIAEQTLLFWESTYGINTSRLSYPSCLVPVLCDLQHKIKIALPGFLHTYVSRRVLKHQTKQQVEHKEKIALPAQFLVATDRYNGKEHANMEAVGGQAETCAKRTEAELASNFKTYVSNEKVAAVKRKPGRPRKLKGYAIETNVLNHESRKSIGEEHNSDPVEKVEIEHTQSNKHASEGNIDVNVKLSTPDEKVEQTKVKCRRTRKHKLQKNTSVVKGKKTVGRKGNARSLLVSVQLDSGKYDKQCERIKDDNTGDHTLISKRVVSQESLEQAKENFKRGRQRKSEQSQIKLLKSDFKTLGIRHLRSLRNAGGLRGGKDWRTTYETAKQFPKISRRQSQQFNIAERNDFKRAKETDTNARFSGRKSSNMGRVDHVQQKHKREVQPCSSNKLSSLICSELETSQKACQTSKQLTSESPFKVRALGGQTWSEGPKLLKSIEDAGHVVPFKCNTYSVLPSENNSDCVSKKNRRKSGTPKRIPSNLISEDKAGICYENIILSQVKVATDEERIFTGKRLRDAGHMLLTSKGWDSAEAATPLKKLKMGNGKGFVKNQNTEFESEDNVDTFYATQRYKDEMTSSTGIDLQVPSLTHHGKSGRKHNLEKGQWKQEGSILDINRHKPKNNSEELEATDEVSSEAQSKATDQCTETEGLHTTKDRPCRGNNQVAQSSEGKKQLQRKTQLSELNGSSGTSNEGCVETSIDNALEYAYTINGEIHHYSKKGLALLEDMGKEWNICDILSEISLSSKIGDLGKEDLNNAEILLLGLSQRIAKRKTLLLETT